MPPSHGVSKDQVVKSYTPRAAKGTKGDKSKGTPRQTLSELSQNTDSGDEDMLKNVYNVIDNEYTFRFTPEMYKKLEKDKLNIFEFISSNLTEAVSYLEIVGWSNGTELPASFYDNLIATKMPIKKIILRGRGVWNTCKCPSKKNKSGELIDTVADRGTTSLEHIIVIRTFTISSCVLLDLISRSPNLKTVRFYGSLTNTEHNELFRSVRFVGDLEGVYWPWCNLKDHKPTLKTLVKRQDQIKMFYSGADITCDFLGADLLLEVKYLSLIMNELWLCEPNKTKFLAKYNRNIHNLAKAKNVEALEVRTYDVEEAVKDEEIDQDLRELIVRNYLTYQASFWQSIAKLNNLKYLSIHGGWQLDYVCQKLTTEATQIEYLRTSLMPASIAGGMNSEDNSNTNVTLSMSDAAKQISKLAKLKSLHFTCHDQLCNIDKQSASALKELSDLIWKIELKCTFTDEVEELLTNILRRGNQNGRSYRIRMVVLIEETHPGHASIFAETIEKFSSVTSLRESLNEVAAQKARERFGKSSFKKLIIYGIEQAGGGRDKAAFDQLRTTWSFYEDRFKPIDMFM